VAADTITLAVALPTSLPPEPHDRLEVHRAAFASLVGVAPDSCRSCDN